MSAGWPAQSAARAFNQLGQYASNPGSRDDSDTELNIFPWFVHGKNQKNRWVGLCKKIQICCTVKLSQVLVLRENLISAIES